MYIIFILKILFALALASVTVLALLPEELLTLPVFNWLALNNACNPHECSLSG